MKSLTLTYIITTLLTSNLIHVTPIDPASPDLSPAPSNLLARNEEDPQSPQRREFSDISIVETLPNGHNIAERGTDLSNGELPIAKRRKRLPLCPNSNDHPNCRYGKRAKIQVDLVVENVVEKRIQVDKKKAYLFSTERSRCHDPLLCVSLKRSQILPAELERRAENVNYEPPKHICTDPRGCNKPSRRLKPRGNPLRSRAAGWGDNMGRNLASEEDITLERRNQKRYRGPTASTWK